MDLNWIQPIRPGKEAATSVLCQQTVTLIQTAACYTRDTHSGQQPTLAVLLKSPPYRAHKHDHTSRPAPAAC